MNKKVKELEEKVAELEANLKFATEKLTDVLDFDELVKLMERDTAKKVVRGEMTVSGMQHNIRFTCPNCNGYIPGIVLKKFCDTCGQRLDWNLEG